MFGKYKGQALGEIVKEDAGYVRWLADKARDEAMRKAAAMLLSKDQGPSKDVEVAHKGKDVDKDQQAPPREPQAAQTGLLDEEIDDGELPF